MLNAVFSLAMLTIVVFRAEQVLVVTLRAEPPKEWTTEKPKYTLRSHQFRLKSDQEGLADAEVIVSQQMRADPDRVFPGLKAQFEPPAGQSIDDAATVSRIDLKKATVHLLDVAGTWNYRERPNDPKSKTETLHDYRVLLAIVVVGDEAAHVRFSGPAAVVKQHHEGFMTWLKSLD